MLKDAGKIRNSNTVAADWDVFKNESNNWLELGFLTVITSGAGFFGRELRELVIESFVGRSVTLFDRLPQTDVRLFLLLVAHGS